MKKFAKQITGEDNVATCVADLTKGEEVFVKLDGKENSYHANSNISFGHKIATKDIKKGESIFKYGTEIGFATQDIKTGDWVHTHNVKDNYEVK